MEVTPAQEFIAMAAGAWMLIGSLGFFIWLFIYGYRQEKESQEREAKLNALSASNRAAYAKYQERAEAEPLAVSASIAPNLTA